MKKEESELKTAQTDVQNEQSLTGEEAEVMLDESELSDEDLLATSTVTLTDCETGEDLQFYVAYEFPFEDEYYYVLVSVNQKEPEALFARSVKLEDGTDGFETLTDNEFEKVAAEYERLCDLMDDETEIEPGEASDIVYNE
ncbi:DUF1292 domain-containing protein [Amygdalobacter nucleatus]|uniref:DUF1292 domain-containing protein n=1 Tax=Amygdalobacter nucleatus TaxID=3029274 RepID=A0A133YH78_9FIRM|nr:DUF1292 domain-containing protein [Amygdalobacter nucleatus]KXB42544.1 hypothetical protein HMPREF1872_00229 [Amygdalobacter nucleatus]MDF0486118.1 DUF1292 domain-containing protein [Amygdalobacter nucleatus]